MFLRLAAPVQLPATTASGDGRRRLPMRAACDVRLRVDGRATLRGRDRLSFAVAVAARRSCTCRRSNRSRSPTASSHWLSTTPTNWSSANSSAASSTACCGVELACTTSTTWPARWISALPSLVISSGAESSSRMRLGAACSSRSMHVLHPLAAEQLRAQVGARARRAAPAGPARSVSQTSDSTSMDSSLSASTRPGMPCGIEHARGLRIARRRASISSTEASFSRAKLRVRLSAVNVLPSCGRALVIINTFMRRARCQRARRGRARARPAAA